VHVNNPSMFPHFCVAILKNAKTYTKSVLGTNCITLFATTFLHNIFHYDTLSKLHFRHTKKGKSLISDSIFVKL
jgi:hypothetical protein